LLLNSLLFFFTTFYTEKEISLSLNLIPGKRVIKEFPFQLQGKGGYGIYCDIKKNPGIEIEYLVDDTIFKPLISGEKIFSGRMPPSNRDFIKIVLRLCAPFNLVPDEYQLEFNFRIEGNVKFEFSDQKEKSRIILQAEPEINLDYSLKDRIRLGEETKVRGYLKVDGNILNRVWIILRLPREVIYKKNSFFFDGKNIIERIVGDSLYFEIQNITPGIHRFEYAIQAMPWTESKLVFIGMSVCAWFDTVYLETPETVHSIFLEADLFYEGGVILGRVFDKDNKGIEGLNLYLEDGTRVRTDKDGRYSFRWVRPGRHIVSFKNYHHLVNLCPGSIYLLDFEISPSRIGPKREYIFLGLGEVGVSGIKNGIKLEELPIDGKLTLYFLGEIEGGFFLEALVNTEGKDLSEFQYLIQPEEKYKVFADRSSFQPGNPGKFYVMVKKGDEYFNAGLVTLEDGLMGGERGMLGARAKKGFGPINLSCQAGLPNYLFHQEEFLVSSVGPYKLLSSPVIINSERVYLETRDILDQKTVLNSQFLMRDKDYKFDYENGKLWLSSHILEQVSMNPRFIVVKYQSPGAFKEIKDINWRVRQEVGLQNILFGLNFNRAGSASFSHNSIGIDENINYKILNLSSQYCQRIENVEDNKGYRIGLNLELYRSQIQIAREYLGKGIQVPYPDYTPTSREENSIQGNFDLHFANFYLAPDLRTFKEERDGEIRNGIGKGIEFGWRVPEYNQRAFMKIGNIKTDEDEYWHTAVGYARQGFSFSPFYRWSEKQRFIGGFLELGSSGWIKFNLEEEYGLDLYHRNSISLEKSGINGRLFFRPKMTYERRLIDDRDYISLLSEGGFIFEPISINTSLDYRKYLKIDEEAIFATYRLVLWPLNDLSIFSQTNLLNKEIKIFESGFAYRPLWLNRIALLGMGKYQDEKTLGAIDLGLMPFKNLNITVGNGMGRGLRYHQAKVEVRSNFGPGLGLDAGLMNQKNLFGANLFYELSPLRLTIGYNYIDHGEMKEGLYARITTNPMKHWAFGLEENALEILDRFIIETPSVVTIGEKFKVKVTAVDKENRILKDFIGSVELNTKASKRRLTFKPEYKGQVIFQLTLSDTKELGANYILIKDRKDRISRAFFYLRRPDEVISYPEVLPYVPVPEIEEYFSNFTIDVPKYAIAKEPFTVEITAMSNKGRVMESFTNGIEILTSNREKVTPDKFYFTPENKGKLKVTLTYPGVETIRLLIRPVGEPLKVSISEPIIFREKGAPPPKPPEVKKPEVKKPSPEEIDALLKQGMKYFTKGQYEDAEKIWKRILALDPANAKAKKYLKETQLRLKKSKG